MMKATTALAFCWCSIISPCVFGQSNMFADAFEEFSTRRLWEMEEIPIDWKMEGILQADLNEGLNNLLEGDLKAAEASLTVVLKKDSTVWQADYYRAAARKGLREFTSSESDLRRALKVHGDFYEGLVELAKILHLSGQVLESERAINKAIRLDRSRGAAYYLRGDIKMAQNDVYGAIRNYKDCLEADSLFHDARIKLALLDALAKNNVGAALKHLNRVLQYDSLQKNALLFRSILVYEKDKRQSVKDLSNLILVSPNNLIGRYFRGVISAELGDYDVAFADFRKVISGTTMDDNSFLGKQSWIDKKIDLQNVAAYTVSRMYGLSENDRRRIKQAFCYVVVGEYQKANAAIRQMFSAYEEPAAVYLLAVAFEHMGAHEAALDHYNRALRLDDQIVDAYKKRGIYEQELKEWAKSVEDFTTVLKLSPDAFFMNRTRGVSYYNMDRFHEALEDFNSYLKKDSTNNEVRGYRGMVYLKTNQRLKAYVDFAVSGNQQALDLKDIEKLVDSVLYVRDTAQAVHVLNLITSNAPYFTEGYVQKFKIHVARNEWGPIADNIQIALRNRRPDARSSLHSYLLTVQGLVYARTRHTDDAVKSLNEAIRLDKKNQLAYVERGRLYLEMGKSSKAENDFRQASALGSVQAERMLTSMSHD